MKTYVINFSKAPGNKSPLNPLGFSLRKYLMEELGRASKDPSIHSIVLTGGPHNFSAGADLTELELFEKRTLTSPSLVDVIQSIEQYNKPVVAAIAGVCLGGGLEVALACHYRISMPNSILGLPEVHVGVIPGAGGTQRLPKLVGLSSALQMILTGTPIKGSVAREKGLVDDIIPNGTSLEEKSIAWASWATLMPLEPRRSGRRPPMEHPSQAHVILQMASLELPPAQRGGEGVIAALEAIRASCNLPLDQGMAVEADYFLRVLQSAQGRARRHIFFAERHAQKTALLPNRMHPLLSKTPGTCVGVIGAGTMGSGIAMVLLQSGFQVHLVDVSPHALEKGANLIRRTIESRTKRGKIKVDHAKMMLGMLQTSNKLESLANAQLVVEAVVENMDIKKNIFRELNRITPMHSVLLSNTSSLDVDKMASVLDPARRKQFAGWHFFSPAHVMKLVEIIVGLETSPETVATLQILTRKINKVGVVVGNCDGFCGNRLLRPYSAETVMLLVEGRATVSEVDQALLDFGMALGPFQLGDLAGNDVGFCIRVERGHARRNTKEPIPSARPDRYTELGDIMVSEYERLGQKCGKGWYDYDLTVGSGRKGIPSAEVDAIVRKYMIHDKQVQKYSKDEIIARCLFPLVNEGFKCLEEGISRRPGDIDIVYCYGYGFPLWRGGPMHWADNEIGLSVILNSLQEMSLRFPTTDHFVPSKLLQHCVSLDIKVEEYYNRKEVETMFNNSKL